MTVSETTTGGSLAVHGGTPVIEPAHRFVWPRVSAADRASVTALLGRGELSYYGREGVLTQLEDLWSARLGGRRTLGLSSGTAALHSAFFALGAGPGDEVLCPTNTFLATVMPLVQLGAVPVLCDAEEETGTIDPASVAAAVTPRTVGIVVTHLWGHPCEMASIMDIARRHGLWVVEDCSHAHGATYRGREVGSLGDAAAFSFQAAKIVYAGQGGLLASAEAEVHERACLLGHFRVRSEQDVRGPLKRYAGTGLGLNYRMHPFAAALALQRSRDMTRGSPAEPTCWAGSRRAWPPFRDSSRRPPGRTATGAPTTASSSACRVGGWTPVPTWSPRRWPRRDWTCTRPARAPCTCCRSFRTGRYPCAGTARRPCCRGTRRATSRWRRSCGARR